MSCKEILDKIDGGGYITDEELEYWVNNSAQELRGIGGFPLYYQPKHGVLVIRGKFFGKMPL